MFAKKTIAKCLLVAGLLTFSYQNTGASCMSGSDGGCSVSGSGSQTIQTCVYGNYWFWGNCNTKSIRLKDL